MYHINIFFLPFILAVLIALVRLAFTNVRGFLLLGAIVAALCGLGWLVNLIAPFILGFLVFLVVFFGVFSGGGSSLLSAFFVHSVVPSVSTGEAYMAAEAHLISFD